MFSNFHEIFIDVIFMSNIYESDWLKIFQRDPAFIVDIIRHMDWLKKYFKTEFTLHEKDGAPRFDSYNQEGLKTVLQMR